MKLSHYHNRHLTALLLLQFLYGSSIAGENRWECQPAADGTSWQCNAAESQQLESIPPRELAPSAESLESLSAEEAQIETQPASAIISQKEERKIPEATEQPAPTAVSNQPALSQPQQESPTPVESKKPEASDIDPYALLLDKDIPWDQCRVMPVAPPKASEENRITIEADAAIMLPQEQRAEFEGNVIIRQPNQTLYADDLAYDHQRQLVKVDQQLLIQLRDLRLLGSKAWFDLNKQQGEMTQISYRIPSRKARGEASKVMLLDKDHSRYENISYTTCPPGNKGFVLSAQSMEIDQKNQIGTFRGAKLRFLGIPVFYAPKLTVSLDDARKSGLLPPSLGYSSDNGLDLTIPYYLNLAPNYDATLMPRLLSRRGLLLGGELRFLTPSSKGDILAEILPGDRLHEGQSSRGAVRVSAYSNLDTVTPGMEADLDINWVSDRDYLDDLGQSLAVTSTRHLRSRAMLGWHQRDWDVIAELLHYKTLDDTITPEDRPYSLLPRVAFNWLKYQGPAGLDYRLDAELSNFYRDNSVTGLRTDIKPQVSLPVRRDWGFVEPAISGRYTAYSLDD
ncbi:MAG TPA: LPS-assembly protein LptD, partial [Thiolapillus brandeum]|nr:LPS-assembly protein LptD [Thiolapillus brandeum]